MSSLVDVDLCTGDLFAQSLLNHSAKAQEGAAAHHVVSVTLFESAVVGDPSVHEPLCPVDATSWNLTKATTQNGMRRSTRHAAVAVFKRVHPCKGPSDVRRGVRWVRVNFVAGDQAAVIDDGPKHVSRSGGNMLGAQYRYLIRLSELARAVVNAAHGRHVDVQDVLSANHAAAAGVYVAPGNALCAGDGTARGRALLPARWRPIATGPRSYRALGFHHLRTSSRTSSLVTDGSSMAMLPYSPDTASSNQSASVIFAALSLARRGRSFSRSFSSSSSSDIMSVVRMLFSIARDAVHWKPCVSFFRVAHAALSSGVVAIKEAA